MKLESSMRRRLRLFAVAVLTAAVGCNNPFSSDEGTEVRLRNASSFELTAVTFMPGAAELKFARIAAGEVTGYVAVANAYRDGYLDLLVGGEHRRLQPIDYVGENYIGDGRFTYVITADAVTRTPSVTLVED